MATYFTSDHHFGHERIIELASRPFRDVREMDRVLAERWAAVVRPTDTVVHLGDLAMGDFAAGLRLVAGLPGRKLLVPGNHDKVFSGETPSRRERYAHAYREAGIEVLPEQVEWDIFGVRVLLCHFPPVGDSHGADRYSRLRPDTRLPVVHGHTHDRSPGRGRFVHVGVDARAFTPVSEFEIAGELASRGVESPLPAAAY